MTPQEFIDLAKTCKNRTQLMKKLGYPNTTENRKIYLAPWCRSAGLEPADLTELFIKTPEATPPTPSPTPTQV